MPEVVIGKDVETGNLITIGDRERCGGFYVLGKPRTGKSYLLMRIAWQDMDNGHGLLFIDPHADAITELLKRVPLYRQSEVIVLDPTSPGRAFGINPLYCANPADLREQQLSFSQSRDVFAKVFGAGDEHLGILLRKYLPMCLYPFIELQGYSLYDLWEFLQEKDFRDGILAKVTYHPEVVDFWHRDFDRMPARDQREEVESLLNRLNILRTNPYIKYVISQPRPTIDFVEVMQREQIVLLRIQPWLDAECRDFIGTLVVSQLLKAIFLRSEVAASLRTPFAIFCDEFQNFATPDFARLFTETGKFQIMPMVAHQVREGQLKLEDPNRGATMAAPSKALFAQAPPDSDEMAPVVALKVEATEKRREAELVISPRPVEDLWERGHPNGAVMDIRGTYFWIVEDLRNTPNEKYFKFDPLRMPPQYRRGNPVNFSVQEFDDWEFYRASVDQLRRGMALLNQYYYDWMGKRYEPDQPLTDAQLELMITVIECVGGLFGFFPTTRPYFPEMTRRRFWEAFKQRNTSRRRSIGRGPMGTYYTVHSSNGIPMTYIFAGRWVETDSATYEAIPRYLSDLGPTDWGFQLQKDEVYKQAIRLEFPSHELEQLIEWEPWPFEPWEKDALVAMMTGEYQGSRAPTIALESLRFFESGKDIPNKEERRYDSRFTQHTVRFVYIELNVRNLLYGQRDQTCHVVVCLYRHDGSLIDRNKGYNLTIYSDSDDTYLWGTGFVKPGLWSPGLYRVEVLIDGAAFASGSFTIADEARPGERPGANAPEDVQGRFGLQRAALLQRLCSPGFFPWKVDQRLPWQLAELKQFIAACFRDLPRLLMQEPLKVPSGKYDESLTVERLQNDLIAEMAMELRRLPARTAYVQVPQQHGGAQVVWQGKIETLPLPEPNGESLEEAIMQHSYDTVYRTYAVIEADIRRRQAQWRRRGDGGSPPPTHLSG